MNSKNKITSGRRLLLTGILSVTSVILLLALVGNTLLTMKREKTQLEQSTLNWANSLAQASAQHFLVNQQVEPQILKDKLSKLITTPLINYVYLYRSQEGTPTQFYTGYRKTDYSPTIPNKIDEIDKLTTIRYQKTYLEIIVKVETEQEFYGYLYIQTSLQEVSKYINKTIIIALFFFLASVIILTFLALRIHRKLNQPILELTDSIQQISQSKDFSRRLTNLSLRELDILAQNINILLNRAQQSMAIQEDIYQQKERIQFSQAKIY